MRVRVVVAHRWEILVAAVHRWGVMLVILELELELDLWDMMAPQS